MKIILFFAALFIANVAISQDLQETEVPANVKKVVTSQYPNAADIEWEMEKGHYEVEFDIDRADHEMLIDKNGKVLMHKGELAKDDLPEAVMNTVSADYSDREVEDVDVITKDGKTYYQVEFDGRVFDDEILVTEDGKVEKEQKAWYNF